MVRRGFWPAALLLAAGCAKLDWPAAFVPARYTLAQLGSGTAAKPGSGKSAAMYEAAAPIAETVTKALLEGFGTPEKPAIAGADETRNAAILRGSRLYRVNCMYCHGMNGDGAGPSATLYEPRPRDYRRGAFKWKSTLANSKPRRSDLRRTLSEGISGTAMPPFKLLPADQLDDLVEYVAFLSQRGETEFNLLYKAQQDAPEKPDELTEFLKEDWPQSMKEQFARVANGWNDAALAKELVPISGTRVEPRSDDDPDFDASVSRGRELFLGAGGCVKCHGLDGKGGSRELKPDDELNFDQWGQPTRPRNLKEGVFRGGRAPVDLFRRIHQGIAPSKMPASEKALKPEQIWDLVNFLRTLPYRSDLLPPAAGAVR